MSKGIVEQFFEACLTDDIEAAVECFAEDGVWVLPMGPEPGTTHKKEEIGGIIADMNKLRDETTAAGVAVYFSDPIYFADKAYVEFSLTDQAGKLMERGIDIFTIRDGKIISKDMFRKA
ncbi:nuclear transport factor 2 family protein [Nocardia lijiangensis]|uniref:nuclear transport factor 2 family protein n=1 Tax=Nocardia lijiangensis TaxID=299618 RepID=UPI00082C024A|nr:nuclear transport factor 2 family protein [Nocardia lijiangensis]